MCSQGRFLDVMPPVWSLLFPGFPTSVQFRGENTVGKTRARNDLVQIRSWRTDGSMEDVHQLFSFHLVLHS